jgi:predicted DNA-binding ArsR family transcriptional regulator
VTEENGVSDFDHVYTDEQGRRWGMKGEPGPEMVYLGEASRVQINISPTFDDLAVVRRLISAMSRELGKGGYGKL